MKKYSNLTEIANAYNNAEPETLRQLEKDIAASGFVSDMHLEFGVCHDDNEKVVIDDDGEAIVIDREQERKKYSIDYANGSGSGCDTLFDTIADARRHMSMWTDEEREGCEIVEVDAPHEVTDVELTKGGYGHDTLVYFADGEEIEVTGEFYVDKDGMLHHTHTFEDGEEIEITLPYND